VLLLNQNKTTHENIFCPHFCHFGSQFIPLSMFSTTYTVTVFVEMSAYYANTITETLSPFVDSNVDNIPLWTNPDLTSRCL